MTERKLLIYYVDCSLIINSGIEDGLDEEQIQSNIDNRLENEKQRIHLDTTLEFNDIIVVSSDHSKIEKIIF